MLKASFSLDFGVNSSYFYNVLKDEDFDFKSKDIFFQVCEKDSSVGVEVRANSILDLKIATSALIKSLEIIQKTLEV
ncbi:MAG: hypothetical protein ACOCXG_02305 [Nanoarchaeota archaeon]